MHRRTSCGASLAVCAVLVLASVHAAVAQDNCRMFDDCSGHGECSADGWFCECTRGWKGLRCVIPPPEIKYKDWVPGLVDAGTRQYYRVAASEFSKGDYVTLEPNQGQDVTLVLNIGSAGLPTDSEIGPEWMDLSTTRGDKEVEIPNKQPGLRPNEGDDYLYITVVGPQHEGEVAKYRLIVWDQVAKGAVFAGVGGAEGYGIIAGIVVGALCFCCFLCLALQIAYKKKKKKKLQEYQMDMMGGNQFGGTGMSGYPNQMMDPSMGGSMMVDPNMQGGSMMMDPNMQGGSMMSQGSAGGMQQGYAGSQGGSMMMQQQQGQQQQQWGGSMASQQGQQQWGGSMAPQQQQQQQQQQWGGSVANNYQQQGYAGGGGSQAAW